MIKKLLKKLNPVFWLIDILLAPLTFLGGGWFRLAKFLGMKYLPFTKRILLKLGCFPIVDHYYDPLFNFSRLKSSFNEPRRLEGISFNEDGQLKLLSEFKYQKELMTLPSKGENKNGFYLNNGSYSGGDAALLYSMIRYVKPRRIIEIGSGFSTLLMVDAIKDIKAENTLYDCELTCIEPYEVPWLENLSVKVLRKKVEDIDISCFEELEENDFLFIDSSHIIRPQGDVLYEMFNILPHISKNVYVHFHDIFSPYEYPEEWLKEEFRLWNEQYLLEAFLSFNDHFEIVFALNFMAKKYHESVKEALPIINNQSGAAFWIKKIK